MMGVVGRTGAEPEDRPGEVERVFRARSASLVGMLTAYVGDRAEAEDLAQEAFVRLQQSWDRIEDPERTDAYLRATAFNLARSMLRRRARRPVPVAADPARSAEDGCVLRDDQRAVLAALLQLPERQRACVVLRYYRGDGIEAIARTLDISANSVKTHLRRGLATLETRLEGHR
jgi:RNA polymerase sigma-70 factor (sigma-E family)